MGLHKASVLLEKSRGRHRERRVGNKPGDVRSRTVIGGRSYDHVRTRNKGEAELHPTNVDDTLGNIVETNANTFIARAKGTDLGEHADHHKAARAIVGHVRGAAPGDRTRSSPVYDDDIPQDVFLGGNTGI